jgi:hypothetical protein
LICERHIGEIPAIPWKEKRILRQQNRMRGKKDELIEICRAMLQDWHNISNNCFVLFSI